MDGPLDCNFSDADIELIHETVPDAGLRAALFNGIASGHLPRSLREDMIVLIASELQETGFRLDWEPNERGLRLERLISRLGPACWEDWWRTLSTMQPLWVAWALAQLQQNEDIEDQDARKRDHKV